MPSRCVHCHRQFAVNPRLKGQQQYCGRPNCQRARKAAWKRDKTAADPLWREDCRLKNKKWAEENPDYWQRYRQKNPRYATRNRQMQRLRNYRNRSEKRLSGHKVIAKVDALAEIKSQLKQPVGEYWLVPVIAKVDALRVKVSVISEDYSDCKERLDRQTPWPEVFQESQ